MHYIPVLLQILFAIASSVGVYITLRERILRLEIDNKALEKQLLANEKRQEKNAEEFTEALTRVKEIVDELRDVVRDLKTHFEYLKK